MNSPAFLRNTSWKLISFFIFSLLFHAIVVILTPNFLSVKRIKIIRVIYMKPIEVRIRKLPPLPPSSREFQRKKKLPTSVETSQFIMRKIQSISLGKGLFFSPPAIQLPVAEVLKSQQKVSELYTSKKRNQLKLGRYSFKSGVPNLLPNLSTETTSLLPSKTEEIFTKKIVKKLRHDIRSENKRLSEAKVSMKTGKKRMPNVKLGVEGPVSERKILYQPPLPTVTCEHSVQIKLKFWVTPNGIVDQIIPIERGGTKLESVAIHFLKKWKFEPLSSVTKNGRQWGILKVKFIVK